MAIARVKIHQRIIDKVDAGSSKTVDIVLANSINSIEYHINMRKSDRSVVKTIKMVIDRDDTQARDAVWSRIGSLNVSVNAQYSSGYFQLQLQNNESFDVYVSVVRQIN
jgi:hypothetical protein